MRAGTLVRNETIKTTRRSAYWVPLLSFGGIAGITVGQRLYFAFTHANADFALPGAWATSLQGVSPLPGLFGAAAVLLLVTSEFSWKTARQNVIDGLSKGEFFLGKLLAWPPVILTFVALLLIIVGGMGLVGTHHAGASGPLVRRADVALMAGSLLAALGYSSIAFFAAFAARSSGAAMGLFFLYVAFVDEILGGLLRRIGGLGTTMAGYLPRAIFDRLGRAAQYDMAARQELIDHALKANRDAPQFMDTHVLLAASLLWILLFLGLSFWVYQRRDL